MAVEDLTATMAGAAIEDVDLIGDAAILDVTMVVASITHYFFYYF
ncbi:hypothetical protein rsdtw13_18400 [Clostridium sp. TW13]|uniref:Uncharacterized protein n=1 Tax=Inconstantimicrobium mannanitabidum TaxID=1604901 RepID=A0ACB5RBP3_9CLOT|nr:hypothetical protein rsdtw13_18400 [Clostridium sp. TW13]